MLKTGSECWDAATLLSCGMRTCLHTGSVCSHRLRTFTAALTFGLITQRTRVRCTGHWIPVMCCSVVHAAFGSHSLHLSLQTVTSGTTSCQDGLFVCVCVCECSFLGGSKWEPTTAFELKINRTLWSATLERTQWCAVDSIENKQFKSRSIVFVQNMRLVLPHMLAGFTGVAFKWHDWSLHLQWPERLLLKLLKETSTTFNSSTLESVQVIWMRDTRTYSIWSDVSEHYSTSLKRCWEPSTT